MASMTERIRVIIDADASGAKKTFTGIKDDIAQADGVIGKAKAGASGLASMIGENVGGALIAGGAALVGFGMHAVGVFEDTAKSAINLAKATGMSTEEASRWIAVADDFQVSAEGLQSALGKVLKSTDAQVWKDYGIATRDASGKVRDTSDVLADALDKISALKTEQEQAKAGTDLFGKGWANIAPLVGHTRDEYQKMLDTVSDGQVITNREASQAERMRLAQDALSDAMQDVTLAVGKLVSSLAPEIQAMSNAVETAAEWVDVLNRIPGGLDTLVKALDPNPIHKWQAAMTLTRQEVDLAGVSAKQLTDILSDGKTSLEDQKALWDAWAESHPEAAIQRVDRSQQDWNDTSGTTAVKAAAVKDATDKAKVSMLGLAGATASADTNADALTRTWDGLTGAVSADQAWLDIQDSFDTIQEKAKDAWEAAKTGAADADAKARDYQRSIDTLKQQVIDYAREVLKLPTEQVTRILADLDGASAAQVEAELKELTRLRYVGIKAVNVGGSLGLPGATSVPTSSSSSVATSVVNVAQYFPRSYPYAGALAQAHGAARRSGGLFNRVGRR